MLGALTPRTARALLSPSAQVLVAAACRDGGLSRAATLPWHHVHWPTLFSLASFERAEAQLARLMLAAPVGAVPEIVSQSLQSVVRVSAFRSAGFDDASVRVIDTLRDAGLSALWLKGAALAMQSEKGFSLRAMGDIDVLLAPESIAAARAALMRDGWRAHGVATSRDYAAHHHDAPLVWGDGVRLELHSGLFPPGHPFGSQPASDWLQRGVEIEWRGRPVRVLPADWHAVHASVHWAWNHEGEIGSWQYLHDLCRLEARLRWQVVLDLAESAGVARPVGWAVWAAAMLTEVQPDSTVLLNFLGGRRVADGLAERQWLLRAFASPSASPSVRWSRFWWRYAMRGLGDQAHEWPWIAGSGPTANGELSDSARKTNRGGLSSAWRRHLAHLLRS
jgi:Uncharacterised nucleotidyltransferase